MLTGTDAVSEGSLYEKQVEVGSGNQGWDGASRSRRPSGGVIPDTAAAAADIAAVDGDDSNGAGEDECAGPKKNIGIFSATAMGVSLMVGSGIFSTPAAILGLVGTPSMALVLWGIGAVISFGGATAFIELGLMYRENGGTMRFLAHAFPKPRLVLSYLFAWVMVVCIRPGAIAANGPV
ncbi:hypothetical protein LPJ59_002250, partial [Coemansia sp. RSA 2399]